MGFGKGLGGAFNIATASAALLGGETEQLTKAFMQVQAVMAVLNGVQEVANVLNKNSAFMVNVRTVAENSSTIAKIKNWGATLTQNATTAVQTGLESKSVVVKTASTAAQWALNTAVTAFPAIMIIAALAAIVFALKSWSDSSKNAAIQAEKEKTAQENLKRSYDDTATAIDSQTAIKNKAIPKRSEQIDNEIKAEVEKWNKTGMVEKEGLEQNKELGIKLSKQDQDRLDELIKNESDYNAKVEKLRYQKDEALADEQIEANKKAIEIGKEHAKYLLEIDKQLEDSKISVMKDGIDKQVAQITLEFDRKIAAVKGGSASEIALRASLEREKLIKINALTLPKALDLQKITGDTLLKDFGKTEVKKSDLLINAETKMSKKLNAILDSDLEKQQKRLKTEQDAFDKKEKKKQQLIQDSAQVIGEIGNSLFSIQSDNLSQQASDLDHYYTTDATEAKNNANLKLISEDELAKKKLDIKIKQAKLDKAQAIFNIGLSTAQAIISALAMIPPNIPLSIIAGITGAAQLATVIAKPLPKYASGKQSGGAGHFATVGELGSETMWIPDNAAIIPHNRKLNFDTFSDFNIPIDSKLMKSDSIDYERLGKVVAKNVKIPTPKPVTVHVDKSGVNVNYGSGSTTYLNKKYAGTWN